MIDLIGLVGFMLFISVAILYAIEGNRLLYPKLGSSKKEAKQLQTRPLTVADLKGPHRIEHGLDGYHVIMRDLREQIESNAKIRVNEIVNELSGHIPKDVFCETYGDWEFAMLSSDSGFIQYQVRSRKHNFTWTIENEDDLDWYSTLDPLELELHFVEVMDSLNPKNAKPETIDFDVREFQEAILHHLNRSERIADMESRTMQK